MHPLQLPQALLVRLLALVMAVGGYSGDGNTTGNGQDPMDDLELRNAYPVLTFQRPVGVYAAPNGSGRVFVVEQAGVIRVFADDPGAGEGTVNLLRSKLKWGSRWPELLRRPWPHSIL